MNEHSQVRIESPALAAGSVHLISLSGKEAISHLFEMHLQVVTTDPAGLDTDTVIGAPAQIVFERGEKEQRRMGGIIAAIHDSMHEETGRMVYDLWIAPRAFRLGLTETYEIFMDLSVPDIVKKKLDRAGLVEHEDYELRLSQSYPPREFTVQYQETDLAFVSRLLEHLGIAFYFDHRDGKDVLILSDDNSGFAPPPGGEEIPFRSRGERLGVFSLESRTRMTPASYLVKDYNYRTPQVALQASAPSPKGDGGYVLEYGAHFKSPDEGAKIARIRAEELGCRRTIYEGKSDQQGLFAGARVTVEGHPRGDLSLIVTEIEHRAANTTLGAGKEHARDYENTFNAVLDKTPFRPARVTPKPRIHGVITGVIDAAAKGPYAELDSDGRYRVRFLFDPGSAGDGQASRLCRMAQPHGGGGYGMHFPLRSGVEVILTFVEGDPDRPIILGVVPNPQTPSPVTSGNGTRNIIRTGGGNEINIDDTGGSERIKMSTPRGKSVLQLGTPNNPTDGIGLSSEGEVSSVAKGSWNVVSPAANVATDVFKILSANDNTQYCTALINVLSMADAFLSGVGNAASLGQEAFSHAKFGAWLERLDKLAEELEDQIKKLEARLADSREAAARAQKFEEEAAAKRAEAEAERQAPSMQRQGSTGPTRADDLDREAGELDALARDARQQAATGAADEQALEDLQRKADAAKKTADDLREKQKDTMEANAGVVAKYGGPVLEGAQQLVSTASAYAGWVAQNAAGVMLEAQVKAAQLQMLAGKVTGVVMEPLSPAFTGGGDGSGSLIGGVAATVAGGMSATVYSEGTASLLGGRSAVMKSFGESEIHAGNAVYVTSTNKIQIEAGADVHVEATNNALSAKSGGPLTMTAGGLMTVTADGGIKATSKKDLGFTIEEGPTNITSQKGHLTLTVNDGTFSVAVDKGPSFLELSKDLALVHHKDWGLAVEKESITLGPIANNKDLKISITPNIITMKHSGSEATVFKNSAYLKGGNTTVSLANSGMTATGKRIDLG